MKPSKVLFIAHRIPYPPNKGDKIRSFHMLRHLTENHRVAVACMIDDSRDIEYIDALNEMVDQVFYEVRSPFAMKMKAVGAVLSGEPFTKPCFYSVNLQRSIDRYLDDNDVQAVICFCSSSAEYVFRSRHYPESLQKKVLLADMVDVDSEKWRQYAEQKSGLMKWLYRREAEYLRPYEQKIAESFDRTFLVSEEEKNVMAQSGAVDKVEALSNGVDLDYFSPESHRGNENSSKNRLVFSGAMDYWPNIEGAVWFVDKVFPAVKSAVPDAVFCIAGRNPHDDVLALRKIPGIEVTGTVPDIRDYLSDAAICVAPLQIARGIQNKVLEGMAMHKAVVATSGAATGLKAVPGRDIIVATGETQMVEAIIRLLHDSDERRQIGLSARRYVECAHSWDAHLGRMSELVGTDKCAAVS